MDFWCATYMLHSLFFFFWNKTNLTYIAYGWWLVYGDMKPFKNINLKSSHSITLKDYVTLTQAMYVMSIFLRILWFKAFWKMFWAVNWLKLRLSAILVYMVRCLTQIWDRNLKVVGSNPSHFQICFFTFY